MHLINFTAGHKAIDIIGSFVKWHFGVPHIFIINLTIGEVTLEVDVNVMGHKSAYHGKIHRYSRSHIVVEHIIVGKRTTGGRISGIGIVLRPQHQVHITHRTAVLFAVGRTTCQQQDECHANQNVYDMPILYLHYLLSLSFTNYTIHGFPNPVVTIVLLPHLSL